MGKNSAYKKVRDLDTTYSCCIEKNEVGKNGAYNLFVLYREEGRVKERWIVDCVREEQGQGSRYNLFVL